MFLCCVPVFRFLIFFFVYGGDIGVLHSFPTRRSSDLKGWRSAWPAIMLLSVAVVVCFLALDRFGQMGLGGLDQRIFLGARSEEHTSELQSRVELVCRLLLEKKKPQASASAIYRLAIIV